MNHQAKNLIKKVSLGLFIGYFLIFLLYYVSVFLIDSLVPLHIWAFAKRLLYPMPLLIAPAVTLLLYSIFGKREAFLALIPFSLSGLIYFLPFYYLRFIGDGFDSIESLAFGALAALGEAILFYLLALLAFAFMLLVAKRASRTGAGLEKSVFKKTLLDFSDPLSLSFASLSLIAFLYFFVAEIIQTVTLIVSSSGISTFGEIAYMVFSYLFDLGLIFAYYFTLVFIKNSIVEPEE